MQHIFRCACFPLPCRNRLFLGNFLFLYWLTHQISVPSYTYVRTHVRLGIEFQTYVRTYVHTDTWRGGIAESRYNGYGQRRSGITLYAGCTNLFCQRCTPGSSVFGCFKFLFLVLRAQYGSFQRPHPCLYGRQRHLLRRSSLVRATSQYSIDKRQTRQRS